MTHFSYTAASEKETARLGAELAAVLPPGSVVVLNGPLGAGKTRLVQAVAEAAGFDRRNVTSPTFTLIHEYAALVPIFHFDVYRVRDDDEFRELGPDEYFSGPGWSFVEWGEKVADSLPTERLDIRIDAPSPTARRFEFIPYGAVMEQTVAALASRLAAQPD